MSAVAVVVAAGVGSYLLRVSMLLLLARTSLPPRFHEATRVAVPAAFAALAATALVPHASGSSAVTAFAAVAAAAAAVHRTGAPHAALVAGMPVVWVLTAVLPS